VQIQRPYLLRDQIDLSNQYNAILMTKPDKLDNSNNTLKLNSASNINNPADTPVIANGTVKRIISGCRTTLNRNKVLKNIAK
jgi:hypothetical protein